MTTLNVELFLDLLHFFAGVLLDFHSQGMAYTLDEKLNLPQICLVQICCKYEILQSFATSAKVAMAEFARFCLRHFSVADWCCATDKPVELWIWWFCCSLRTLVAVKCTLLLACLLIFFASTSVPQLLISRDC